ncbi:MAG: amidohydrolase family protein [Candidatus Spechtbacteria bacterium]|nr:amidohydrolase family protein [Candidatus Spechtbacteria bacterium]
MQKKNRVWTVHLRNEDRDILPALNEIVTLAREVGIRSHISHIKALGKDAWGEFPKSLEMLNAAKESGVNVNFDLYPYDRTATVLYLLLPEWATAGGRLEVLKRLGDRVARKKIKEELAGKAEEISKIVLAYGDIDRTLFGKSIGDIASNQKSSPIEALLDVIIVSGDRVVGFMPSIDEANIRRGIESEMSIVASDGAGYGIRDRKEGMLVHPRSFGAFPKFLGRYVRESRLVSWETAVRKISSYPAETIGMSKRGRIAKGYMADIVIFDPKKIVDRANFQDPFQYAEGIEYVIVNGGIALRKGKFQKARYGRVLHA